MPFHCVLWLLPQIRGHIFSVLVSSFPSFPFFQLLERKHVSKTALQYSEHPWAIHFVFIWYEINQDLGFSFDTTRYRSIFLAPEMTFWGFVVWQPFFKGNFSMTFFRHLLWFFLNKGGGSLELWNFQRCVFGLKIRLFWRKRQKITIYQCRRHSILRIRYSILFDTVKRFEISGIDRHAIRYSQRWLWRRWNQKWVNQ